MLSPIQAAIVKERVRRGGLWEFVKAFWPVVETATLIDEPHMRLICRHLQYNILHAAGGLPLEKQPWMDEAPPLRDLVVACPPGVSKSLICMVFAPAWAWTWCPALKIGATSYSEKLAFRDAERSYSIIYSDLYRELWPIQIEGGDRASMAYYVVEKHLGSRLSVQMGGAVTGRHFHWLVADDPTKPQGLEHGGESASDFLELVKNRWDNVFSSRSADPATFAKCVIAQRLHVEDLSGHCVNNLGYQHLYLPMEFDAANAYRSPWGDDHRSVEGELLCPRRFPPHVVESRRKIMTKREFDAQMNQRPSPDDGSIFERGWFGNRYDALPSNNGVVLSVDCSNKETDDSDFFVVQAWMRHEGRFYLVDQIRKRAGFHEQVVLIETLRRRYANPREILVEEKAAGGAVIEVLRRQYPGVIAVQPLGGKIARMKASTWLWSSNSVVLPSESRAPWIDEYVEEHIRAPVGKYDDQVDCSAQYLTWASNQDSATLLRRAMDGVRARMYGY